jgi:hypothetical protein
MHQAPGRAETMHGTGMAHDLTHVYALVVAIVVYLRIGASGLTWTFQVNVFFVAL